MKSIFTCIAVAGMIGTGFAQEANEASTTVLQTSVADQRGEKEQDEDAALLEGMNRISQFNKASSFMKMPVKSADGKEIGKVQDMVFDPEKGHIGYVVLAVNGSEGGQARSVPVPLSALKPAESREHLVLNMSESVLAASSGIAGDDWPEVETFSVGGPAESEAGAGRSSEATGSQPKEIEKQPLESDGVRQE